MKWREPSLAVLAATMIGLAAPAHADPAAETAPEADNTVFLTSLQAAGITYSGADQVISAAKAMCELVGSGESGLEIIKDLKANNPGFTTDAATQFASIAAHSYCPHQLATKNAAK